MLEVTAHLLGSDLREFVGSNRKTNASASTMVTPCIIHLLGGFVLESDLPVFKFSESDDDGIFNVVTLLESSSGSFLKRRLDMSCNVYVDVIGAINLYRFRPNQLS
jgi:hypothetical protein